jgi:hypothetical protein
VWGIVLLFKSEHIYGGGKELGKKKHARMRAIELSVVRANSSVVVVGLVVCVVWSTLTF